MGCGGGVNREVQTYMPSGASKDSVVMTAAAAGTGCCADTSVVPPGRGRMDVGGKAIEYAILSKPMDVDGDGGGGGDGVGNSDGDATKGSSPIPC